ncbi:histidine kinase [Halopseudomonas pelagia]|uniref:histidine kinase n=1 Tax=Halopseudomonas pelagia TaxID=553151 RepID=UPI00039AD57B|nr:histidine kinase [Halopseudomonas pelagia]
MMTPSTRNESEASDANLPAPRHSIVFSTMVAFVIIICVTLVSMIGGLHMADSLEGDAGAINQAGSLRMQAYRLALIADQDPTTLEHKLQAMDATLGSASIEAALLRHDGSGLRQLHTQALEQWQQTMRPLLQTPAGAAAFRAEVPQFVAQLDQFVQTLQESSEKNLEIIRALQVGTLFVTVLIAFLLIFALNNKLVTPLRQLTAMARQISRGNFTGQVSVAGDTELSMLARTLNQMNQELASLYAEMESKVDEKTAALTRSNATLQLLFDSARLLYSRPDEPVLIMGRQLSKVRDILGCGPVSLCLNRVAEAGSHTAMTSTSLQPPAYCKLPDCQACPVNHKGAQLASGSLLISFDLRSGQTELGALRIEQPPGEQLEPWQTRLMITLADLYAACLILSDQGQQQARMALMEERAVIARELHDSLAQSLSAQKLQLARLKRQTAKGCAPAELTETMEEIERGLNAAYRQLRELLTTFRIKVNEPGLKPALQATVKEFGANSGVDIQMDYRLDHCPLTPNEEIHCLQIVREALSNVVKHAQAKSCALRLTQDKQGTIHVTVDDDGVGIAEAISPAGHYGVSILIERANSLNGTLTITPREVGGTRVYLRFPPDYRLLNLKQERTGS